MPDPWRISIVVSTLTTGGAEQLLLDLLRDIDRTAFTIRLAFLQSDIGLLGHEVQQLDYETEVGLRKRRLDPLCPWRLQRWLRSHDADVVLGINHLDALVYGLAASKAAGAAYINWENETARRYRAHRVTMALRSLLLGHVDRVVAVAHNHKEYIIEREHVPPSHITVIPNGVAPDRVTASLTPAEAKARLGLAPDARVTVQVAGLRPDKAHTVMLHAFDRVRRACPQAVLLLAGDGPCRDDLERLAAELGLGDSCRFLGVRRDIANILAASDIFALSSAPLQETLSVAAIEAMFAGLPVVSTAVGSMAELVEPERTGLLVPPADPEALADALIRLLDDPGTRQAMGQAGREAAFAHYTLRGMVTAFETLFADLARARRARRAQ